MKCTAIATDATYGFSYTKNGVCMGVLETIDLDEICRSKIFTFVPPNFYGCKIVCSDNEKDNSHKTIIDGTIQYCLPVQNTVITDTKECENFASSNNTYGYAENEGGECIKVNTADELTGLCQEHL